MEINDFKPLTEEALPVRICIRDSQGEEEAPWVRKIMKKMSVCPDHTHLRFNFQDGTFLAVPLALTVQQTGREWCACDLETGLSYLIRMEEKTYA